MKEKQIHIRVTDEEKEKIEKNALSLGFKQTSEYLRFLGLLNVAFEIDSKMVDGVKKAISSKIVLRDN